MEAPLNAFTCCFEFFLHITTNLVNFQMKPTPKHSHVQFSTQVFKKAEEVKENEEPKTTLKWEKLFFDVILGREILT